MSHDTGSVPATEPAGQWVKSAACKEDADAMFPGISEDEIEFAKGYCRSCPVVDQCLRWALETREEWGVWGGLSEGERRNMLRRRGRGKGRQKQEPAEQKKREPAKCGTRGGYRKHLREKTKICPPCRQANTDADNRLRRTGTTKATA